MHKNADDIICRILKLIIAQMPTSSRTDKYVATFVNVKKYTFYANMLSRGWQTFSVRGQRNFTDQKNCSVRTTPLGYWSVKATVDNM